MYVNNVDITNGPLYEEDGELYLRLENKDFIKKHNVKIESITVHKHFDWVTL